MGRRNYKAVLIDLDGVLRLWPSTYDSLERSFGLPPHSISKVAFDSKLLYSVISGEISDEEWRVRVEKALKAAYSGANVGGAIAAWSSPIGEVNRPVLDLIVQVRKNLKVVLVTNATSRLAKDLNELGLKEYFDVVINSSEIGHVKPSKEIFVAAVAAGSARVDEALFVDDSIPNIKAATELGITTHHFTGSDALSKFLREMGIL